MEKREVSYELESSSREGDRASRDAISKKTQNSPESYPPDPPPPPPPRLSLPNPPNLPPFLVAKLAPPPPPPPPPPPKFPASFPTPMYLDRLALAFRRSERIFSTSDRSSPISLARLRTAGVDGEGKERDWKGREGELRRSERRSPRRTMGSETKIGLENSPLIPSSLPFSSM